MIYHHQIRQRRNVVVPKVMADELTMPDPLSGARFESDHGICVQIVAEPVATVKIIRGRTESGKYDASAQVDPHAAPGVHAAAIFPAVALPGLMPRFPWPRNRVKSPRLL